MSKKYDFDVDIVIPWVDGSDRNWLLEKNKYFSKDNKTEIDASIKRYRDWDNLQYIFRGIEKFAPWVRKIFFVTCGQKPKWLNLNNEKLVFVNHKDYMPSEFLPTFSANPIELNIHRIKDLSEHFIYMNDDLFFTKPTKKSDFFSKEGLPRIVGVEKQNFADEEVFFQILHNNIKAIEEKFPKQKTKLNYKNKFFRITQPVNFFCNKIFNKFGGNHWCGFYIEHLPSPFLKSSIKECWNNFEDILYTTSLNKFRSVKDVNQYLFTEYLICTGMFNPDRIGRKGRLFNINDSDDINFICNAIVKQKYKSICLNDSYVCNFDETRDTINSALEKILPEKSSFEI